MSISLYSATVPVFNHYLQRLSESIEKAATHAHQNGTTEAALLEARLAEGMFPLAQQVSTACGFALRACYPLLGAEVPALAGGTGSFAELGLRIGAALHALREVPEAELTAAEAREITTQAGFATRCFSGRDYALHYALPNFFFHLSMAHAILRHCGVPLGKQDFDGYHAYPAGFSFAGAGSA